jgi:hypothetical protein
MVAPTRCPFGCQTVINRRHLETFKRIHGAYQAAFGGSCVYRCVSPMKVACVSNTCFALDR